MGNFTNPQVLSAVGIPAESVISKMESHKLCHAFPVASDATIKKGQPVYISANNPNVLASGDHFLGIALTSTEDQPGGGPYKPKEITVACRGFAIVKGIAAAQLGTSVLYLTYSNGKYSASADNSCYKHGSSS
jgi:hypothetical protein